MASSIFLGMSVGNQVINGDVTINGELALSEPLYVGTSTAPIALPEIGVTVYADEPLQLWSNFATGMSAYTSATSNFRAPVTARYRNHGTLASPGFPQSGDWLGYDYYGGWVATDTYEHSVSVQVRAAENWDATHRGVSWTLNSTPAGAASESAILTVVKQTNASALGLGIGTNTAPDGELGLGSGATIHYATAGKFKNQSDGVWSFQNNAASAYGSLQIASDVFIGYSVGARSTRSTLQSVTTAVTLSGATSTTGNVIPAGATVESVSTTTTTTITGATGYQVGDGTTATRFGDITGTAVGTNSGSANYTADPRWWTNTARAIVLTAKTSNFTAGVVQVTVFYWNAVGA